jgi:hypothetical protein
MAEAPTATAINVPVTPEDRATLELQARAQGKSLEAFVRDAIQLGLWVMRERAGGADVIASRPGGQEAVLKATRKYAK